MKLYRFISLEDFINIAVNKKDRFTRPCEWADKYEAYLMSMFDTEDGIQQVLTSLYDDVSPRNYNAVLDNFYKLWHSKWNSYAQCWSKNAETDAMWRIYSYGNHAIRIRSTDKKILDNASMLPPKGKYSVTLRRVEYDVNAKGDIIKKQTNQMRISRLIQESYFHKRKAFQHEKEYRLLITDNTTYVAPYQSMKAKHNISEEIKGKTESEIIACLTERIKNNGIDFDTNSIPNNIYMNITQLSNLIDGVMVHPDAEDWYVSIIKEICEREGIRFDGRSEIYSISNRA